MQGLFDCCDVRDAREVFSCDDGEAEGPSDGASNHQQEVWPLGMRLSVRQDNFKAMTSDRCSECRGCCCPLQPKEKKQHASLLFLAVSLHQAHDPA